MNQPLQDILIIEDDPAQINMLTDGLRQQFQQCEVATAGDADAGWQLLEQHSAGYGVVLLDWKLGGGVQGIGLLNRLRSHERYRTTPVLVISGYLTKEDFALMEEFPFTQHLAKPFSLPEVSRTVQDFYRQSQWFQERRNEIEGVLGAPAHRVVDGVQNLCSQSPKPGLIAVVASRQLREQGDLEGALEIVSSLSSHLDNSPLLMAELGKIYLAKGMLDAARTVLERAYQKSPKNLDRLMDLGAVSLQSLDTERAVDVFQQAHSIDPEDHEVQRGLAVAEEVHSFVDSADPQSLPTSYAGVLNALGISMVREGRHEDGVRLYQDALGYVSEALHKAKLCFNLGLAYRRDRNNDQALKWLRKACEYFPKYGKALRHIAAMTGQNPVAAELRSLTGSEMPDAFTVSDPLGGEDDAFDMGEEFGSDADDWNDVI